ncbi:MAG: MMPL family transporter, partial [Spirochaetota bacterium]
MFSLPARLYDKAGVYLIIPVLLLTVVAVLLTTRLDFESGFRVFLPDDDPYQQLSEEFVETFGQNDLVIVALDVDGDISPTALDRIDDVTTVAAEIPGAREVISLTNLQDLYQVDGTLEQRQVYRPAADPTAEELARRILETPLFRKLFVSQDEEALYTYIVPDEDIVPATFGEEVIERLDAPDLHFFGDSVAKAFVSRTIVSELVVLGTIAVIIILLFETLISRSLLVGLTLSVVSIVPSFWTLAFFHVIGGAVQTNTMMVPVIVLVLATSYGIHIYRYHSIGDGNMTRTLLQVGRVVMAAGATTLIGFGSLLVTPSRMLSQLGILLMFGIVAALITALFLLPPILDLLPERIWAYSRRDGPKGGRPAPDQGGSSAADPVGEHVDDHPANGAGPVIRWLTKPPKRPVLRLAIAGGVL